MKKFHFILPLMLLCIAVSLAFSSCGEHEHTASDWITDAEATCAAEGARYKECTECGEVLENEKTDKTEEHTEVTDPRVEPTLTETGLTEGSHCSVCGKVFVEQEEIPMLPAKATLTTNSLTIDGLNIIGRFPHFTEAFDFANNIAATNNATWVVSTDVFGMQTVATKTVPLSEGENGFYIHVTNPDQSVSTYTVTLYRNRLCTVSFNSNGGTAVENQAIEEGLLASKPTDPTRAGYTFVGWDYNFANPISSNLTVNASWNANTDTVYKVEYYLENADKNGYDLIETLNLTGTTDTTATAEKKTYEHFTFNEANSVMSGNINGGGSLVLKVCYTRNSYTVTSYVNNSNAGTVTSGGTYAYNKSTTLTATANIGYTFLGWFDGNDKICDTETFSFNVIVDRNIEARFEVLAEMQGFNFTSTASTCTITGIKDKSAKEIVIPNYVTGIASQAFENHSNLTNISIGNNVKNIESYAFSGCTNLASVIIPDSVTGIGAGAFNACSSLKNATIGDNVTSIGEKAFYNCTELASVTIGDNVTSIGNSAFSYCYKLVEVIDKSSLNISAGSYSYGNVGYYALEVHSGESKIINQDSYLFYTYKGVNYLLGYVGTATNLVLPSSYNGNSYEIYKYAFSCCYSLTSVTIPNSVTDIGYEAFAGCYRLVEVVNKSTLNFTEGSDSYGYIGYYALEVHSGDSKIENKNGYLFYTYEDFNYLICYVGTNTQLILPDSYNGANYKIYDNAFIRCNSFSSVTIPNSVTSIGSSAFAYCESLTSVIIGNNVTNISNSAFYNCYNLKSIKYRGTEVEWNSISKAGNWNYNIGVYTITYNYTED